MLLRKPVVFMDSMFEPPKRFWREWSARLCLAMSSAVVGFSRTQILQWAQVTDTPSSKFECLDFSLDLGFYEKAVKGQRQPRHVFAVGRDVGRDFRSLVEALDGMGISLELVTLPYLSHSLTQGSTRINLKERVSYQQLFDLYSGAIAAVVPLKPAITYPSGIRAVLEAMIVGAPVIATRTPVLEEHFKHGEHLLFADPSSPASIREQIERLNSDSALAETLTRNARVLVEEKFSMMRYSESLASLITRLMNRREVRNEESV
jgi:glycosyltransferase involved in cell wall biosynthesis